MRVLWCAGALALGLSGCAALGPNYVVSPRGAANTGNTGTIGVFSDAYNASQSNASEPTKAANMVAVGTELEYQLCADFFRNAGHAQQWLLFSKDFLAVAGAIATGVLGAAAAASGGINATAIAWTGLSAASGVALLNTFERNFLFSENNVQAVQDLTLKAVSVARAQALSKDRMSSYTFASAVSALVDVQSQCEVQNILVLVRLSIGSANPVPITDFSSAATDIVKAKLGFYLFNGNPISDEQLQSLYWLLVYTPRPTDNQKKNKIYPELSVFNPAPVKADGTPNPTFDNLTPTIIAAFGALPQTVVDQIRANIKTLAGTESITRLSRFDPLPSPGGAASGRIGVTIR